MRAPVEQAGVAAPMQGLASGLGRRSVLLARAATAGHLWLSAPLLGLRHERHVLAVRVFASRAVVVVESPTKAKKIQGFLGDDYQVLASYGHVRDLPPQTGSVLPERDFEMRWELSRGAGPRLAEIEQALRSAAAAAGINSTRGGASGTGSEGQSYAAGTTGASSAARPPLLVLATDPDREGEAISWHLMQELQRRGALPPGGVVQRITFTEVTKAAVQQAMSSPRQVSRELVDAYMARRALDYLVGFGISPVLWRRLPGARSAGRVQSVALRLASEREDEIDAFKPQEYWSVDVQFRGPDGKLVNASLVQVDGRKLHPLTGIPSQQVADQLVARIRAASFQVAGVELKAVQRSPPPPFTTATLQQEASRKLGFGAKRTMQTAQHLYEGAGTGEGLITYMRTDGLQLAGSAVADIRRTAQAEYGQDAVPDSPRFYKSRAKNTQEAHEAIRPTRASLRPARLSQNLDRDLQLLYELVWRRALACQMSNALLEQVGANIVSDDGKLTLRATGSTVQSPGYLQVYDRRYQAAADEDKEEAGGSGPGAAGGGAAGPNNSEAAAATLAKLKVGDALPLSRVSPQQHFTRPPPRFTDASLIKELEQRGIGRPSTYAAILSVLQARGYIVKEGRSLRVSPLGRMLAVFLQRYFPTYVDYDFTSNMEEQLDEVSGGRSEWRALMRDFWQPFDSAVQGVLSSTSTTDVFNMLDERLGHIWLGSATAPGASAQQPASAGAGPTPAHRNSDVNATASSTVASSSSLPASPTADSTTIAPSASPSSSLDLRTCPMCGTGRLTLKPSRYGGFIGCSNFSDTGCQYKRPLVTEEVVVDEATGEVVRGRADGGRLLGYHPDSGLPVVLKPGPYGPYLELEGSVAAEAAALELAAAAAVDSRAGGEAEGAGGGAEVAEAVAEAEAKPKKRGRKRKQPAAVPKVKPRRATVPKGKVASLTLEDALALLQLPRLVGLHPTDGQPILADAGRYGPYLKHASLNVSLGKKHNVHEVSLEQAVELLEAKKAKLADQEARGIKPRWGKKKAGIKVAKGRKRAAKAQGGEAASGEAQQPEGEGTEGVSKAKARGRKAKAVATQEQQEAAAAWTTNSGEVVLEVQTAKRRGRPRKSEQQAVTAEQLQESADQEGGGDQGTGSVAGSTQQHAPRPQGHSRTEQQQQQEQQQEQQEQASSAAMDAIDGAVGMGGVAQPAARPRGRPRKVQQQEQQQEVQQEQPQEQLQEQVSSAAAVEEGGAVCMEGALQSAARPRGRPRKVQQQQQQQQQEPQGQRQEQQEELRQEQWQEQEQQQHQQRDQLQEQLSSAAGAEEDEAAGMGDVLQQAARPRGRPRKVQQQQQQQQEQPAGGADEQGSELSDEEERPLARRRGRTRSKVQE